MELCPLKNWLVYYPPINNFEWKRGVTLGSSPHFLILTVLSYIFFTLAFHHSSYRPQNFPLRTISAVYNLISFALSLIMAVGCGLSILCQMPSASWIVCFPANDVPTRGPVLFWGYVFYLSKVLEFTDTLLIILSRSSSRRLSFLHVYHHSMVMIMCYIWVDTSMSLFPVGVVLNSGVHTVMYFYFFMCSVGISPSWKKFVTSLQIVQFVSGFIAGGFTAYYHFLKYPCNGPMYAWCFSGAFTASLLLLFVDFYSKSYNNNKGKIINTE